MEETLPSYKIKHLMQAFLILKTLSLIYLTIYPHWMTCKNVLDKVLCVTVNSKIPKRILRIFFIK